MALDQFLNLDNGYEQKMKQLQLVKEKLLKEGIPPNLVQYKAEEIVFTPEQLEKINFNTESNAGLRPSLTFYFNDKEEIKLVNKYLNISYRQMAVKNSGLLIDILKMMEEVNNVKPV